MRIHISDAPTCSLANSRPHQDDTMSFAARLACDQLRETLFHVAAEMHAQRPAFAVGENLEVAASLGRFHHAESVLLPGNR